MSRDTINPQLLVKSLEQNGLHFQYRAPVTPVQKSPSKSSQGSSGLFESAKRMMGYTTKKSLPENAGDQSKIQTTSLSSSNRI